MIELNRTLLFQVINFLVLMGFLYLFLFKPIKRFLAQRSETIRKSLEDAETSRAEAQKKLSDYTELISQAQQKVEVMKDAAEREALDQSRQTIKEAKKEARRLIDLGKEEIERAVRDARQELKKEVVDLAAALAEKVIKRSLKEEDQHRLIENSIDQLKEKD